MASDHGLPWGLCVDPSSPAEVRQSESICDPNDSGGIWCITGINNEQKQQVFYCNVLSE
jgi:hypothetical protein